MSVFEGHSEKGRCIRSDRMQDTLRALLHAGRTAAFGIALSASISLCNAIIPATVFAEENGITPVVETIEEPSELAQDSDDVQEESDAQADDEEQITIDGQTGDNESVEFDKTPVGTVNNDSVTEPVTEDANPETVALEAQDVSEIHAAEAEVTTQDELTSATVIYAHGDQGTWNESTTTYTVNRSSNGTWDAMPAFPSDAAHTSSDAWNYGKPVGNDGYQFTGWAKGTDTSKVYSPEEVAGSTPDAATVTWTAQWKAVDLKITFNTTGKGVYVNGVAAYDDVNGKFLSGKDPSGTYALSQSITMPVTEKVFKANSSDPWKPYGWTNVNGGTVALLEGNKSYTVKEIVQTLGLTSMADLTLYPIFHEAELKIYYNANDTTLGNVTVSQEEIGVVSQYSSNTTSGSVATGTAGTFNSWTLDKSKPATTYADVSGSTIVPNISKIENSISADDLANGYELNFYAMFDPPAYRVTYSAGTTDDGNAIIATVPSTKAVGYNTTTGLLDETGTRAGYKFTYWYLDSKLTVLASSAASNGDPTYEQMSKLQTPVNNVITLYAGWEEVQVPYTVTWKIIDYLGNDVENGTLHTDATRKAPLGSNAQATDDDIALVPLSADEVAKTKGYSYDNDHSTTSILLDSETGTYNLILAYKELSDFSVSYSLMGGSGGQLADGNPIKDRSGLRWLAMHLNASTAVDKIPVRAGYDFKGWYVTPTTDSNGQSISPATDYTVAFPESDAQYGPTYATLVNNEPGVKGILIYAGWKEQHAIITYTISDSAAGTLSNQNDDVPVDIGTDSDVVGSTVSIPAATGAGSKAKWTFKGWKQVLSDNSQADVLDGWVTTQTDADGTVKVTIKPQKTAVDGTSLYQSATYMAVFEKVPEDPTTPKNYVIRFDGNGPTSGIDVVKGTTGTGNKQSMVEDVAADLAANGFSRTGFTFNGWNTVAKPHAGEGAAYKNGEEVINVLGTDFEDGASITLYAQWSEIEVQISYVTSGKGSLTRLSESVPVVYGTAKGCFASAATGYKFVGWTVAETLQPASAVAAGLTTQAKAGLTAQATAHNVVVDPSDPTLSLQKGTSGLWVAETYVANFEPITYTLNYAANGGSGTMASEKYTYDVTQAIKNNDFTRDGYEFTGWNTAADGSGVDVDTSYSASKLTDVDNDAVTLYAQWNEINKEDPKTDPDNGDPASTTDPTDPADPTDDPTDEPADDPTDPTNSIDPADDPANSDPTTDNGSDSNKEQGTETKTTDLNSGNQVIDAVDVTSVNMAADATLFAAVQEARSEQAAEEQHAPGALPQTGDLWSGSLLGLLAVLAFVFLALGIATATPSTQSDLID